MESTGPIARPASQPYGPGIHLPPASHPPAPAGGFAPAPRLAALLASTILGGLWLDQHTRWGQPVVNLLVWALFLGLCWRSERQGRVTLLACLAFATAGEVILSLAIGLYDYRLGNLPLFVPPGHAILLLLGLQVVPFVGTRLAWAVPLLAGPVVAWQAVTGQDRLGLLLFGMLLVAMWRSRGRRLYAVMFLLALAMELYGTWLGNWTWRPAVPGLGWPTRNPPLCAGAFYCVLDLLVLLAQRWFLAPVGPARPSP